MLLQKYFSATMLQRQLVQLQDERGKGAATIEAVSVTPRAVREPGVMAGQAAADMTKVS